MTSIILLVAVNSFPILTLALYLGKTKSLRFTNYSQLVGWFVAILAFKRVDVWGMPLKKLFCSLLNIISFLIFKLLLWHQIAIAFTREKSILCIASQSPKVLNCNSILMAHIRKF